MMEHIFDLCRALDEDTTPVSPNGPILLANSLGVYFNAIAQRLCIGMFLAPSTSNDLVRHGICSIFGFANRAPFKFQLTVFRKPLVVVGWCLHHES